MRGFLKWTGRVLLVLAVVIGAGAAWKWPEITRLRHVLSLFEEDRIVSNFSNMEALFLTAPVPAGGAPRPLPADPRPLPETFTHGGGEDRIEDWIERTKTTSLLVLKDGRVAHERYRLGTGPEDLRMSWSVAKSVVSSLVGIAWGEGLIDDLDAPVSRWVPELAQSAYAGASLRDVLNMASGVEFDEDYADFNSDINQMGRVLALGASMDAFAAGQERIAGPPGEAFRYVSVDTHVVSMVLRAATGRTLTEYLSEKLWGPMGAEADARFVTDGLGAAFALGGLNARTRDYARFGLLVAEGGARDGVPIIPRDWLAQATRRSAPPPPPEEPRPYGYGFQWWIPPGGDGGLGGEVLARGVYGQFLYIRPAENLVIVKTSGDRLFNDPVRRANLETTWALRAIADAMR